MPAWFLQQAVVGICGAEENRLTKQTTRCAPYRALNKAVTPIPEVPRRGDPRPLDMFSIEGDRDAGELSRTTHLPSCRRPEQATTESARAHLATDD
jgi:hypothetical protein